MKAINVSNERGLVRCDELGEVATGQECRRWVMTVEIDGVGFIAKMMTKEIRDTYSAIESSDCDFTAFKKSELLHTLLMSYAEYLETGVF